MVRSAQTRLIGPFFFHDSAVTGESYRKTPQYYAMCMILYLPASPIFQQDYASLHFSFDLQSYLDIRIFQRWISSESPIAWPPRSPHLTSSDLFL